MGKIQSLQLGGDLAAEVRGDFAALRTDAYMGVPLIYLDSGVRIPRLKSEVLQFDAA